MPRWAMAQAEQLDAELRAVFFELAHLLRGGLDRDRRAAEDLLGARRRRVVHGGERAVQLDERAGRAHEALKTPAAK